MSIVFLLEELSMKELLEGLLPRLFPEISFICIPHEGKHDLEKSIPRKLRGWNKPDDSFIVILDNDGADCQIVKQKLLRICRESGDHRVYVRIACQELEAWYFGEPQALAVAFCNPRLQNIGKKSKYRDPDAIMNPSQELKNLIVEFQKVSGARRMAQYLSRLANKSRSFEALMVCIENELKPAR